MTIYGITSTNDLGAVNMTIYGITSTNDLGDSLIWPYMVQHQPTIWETANMTILVQHI